MGGPCGCGDMSFDKAYRLPDGTIMAYDEYRGCKECAPGIGGTIYFFPSEENEWLEDVEIEDAPIDEYGGNRGFGLPLDLLEVRDILSALPEIEADEGKVGPSDDDYETMADWLHDNALKLIQRAMHCRDLRRQHESGT